MNVEYFLTGGYVIHGIRLQGSSSRFSAWFDQAGELLDAERIDGLGRSYAPREKQRNQLAQVGYPYANT